MNKVYQSIVDPGKGDCVRAVMASLFDMELLEVPPMPPDENQNFAKQEFLNSKGIEHWCCFHRSDEEPTLEEVALYDGGINGYFYAAVPSQTFEGVNHAVIVDKNLNVVHDPNPNQLAMKLDPKDVIYIITADDWIIMDGKICKRTL